MPIPNRDRELLEAAGFVIRETDNCYLVVPRDPPPDYDKGVSGKPIAVGSYFKGQQSGDTMMLNTFIDSPGVKEYREKAMRALTAQS